MSETLKTILAFFGTALLIAAWLGAVVAPIAFVWKSSWLLAIAELIIVGFATPLVYKTIRSFINQLKIKKN